MIHEAIFGAVLGAALGSCVGLFTAYHVLTNKPRDAKGRYISRNANVPRETLPSRTANISDATLGSGIAGASGESGVSEAYTKASLSYAVSGSPRHVPWSQRRKEIEAGQRTKRAQLESLREAE